MGAGLVDATIVRFGVGSLIVSCGAFGGRGMLEILKDVKKPFQI